MLCMKLCICYNPVIWARGSETSEKSKLRPSSVHGLYDGLACSTREAVEVCVARERITGVRGGVGERTSRAARVASSRAFSYTLNASAVCFRRWSALARASPEIQIVWIELQDDIQDLAGLGVFAPARERFGLLPVIDRLGVRPRPARSPAGKDFGLGPTLLLLPGAAPA